MTLDAFGVNVTSLLAPPAAGISIDSATLFVPVKTDSGSADANHAYELRSMGDFSGYFGVRDTANRASYDYCEAALREGVNRIVAAKYTTDVDTALALFGLNYGPGQVAAPLETPGDTTRDKVKAHCEAFSRVPLLDTAVDSFDAGHEDDLTALVAGIDGLEMSYFGPWATIPAPSGVSGVGARQVPASAIVAGLIARADALGHANRAAAGRDFPLQYATGFVADVADANRDVFLDGGLNTFANVFGVLELYGFQTGVAESQDTPFWQLNAVRMRMVSEWDTAAIAVKYRRRTLDGHGTEEGKLKQEVENLFSRYYRAGALYGASPREAYAVSVGTSVNNDATAAQGFLNVAAQLRFSLHTKSVNVRLVDVPVSGAVTAGD